MFVRSIQFFVGLALLGLVLAPYPSSAAVSRTKGASIYRQMCAKCHGRNGEGVKGKYNEQLYGELTVEKLAKVISKTMPEDKPGTCVGPDAEAVSHYIYDAFYSRQARARNHPARVELVRLTNRQYLNTVADLVDQFNFATSGTNSQRGLQARYYTARGFREERKFVDRIDSQVDFDFGTNHPVNAVNPTNSLAFTNVFSMQWRGSLLAEETGDYEFVVKTPNGVRLYVNEDEKALIEATVTSGGHDEHRASVRLIGGRSYPLLLEFFKSNEKRASISLQWKPPHGVQEVIPSRNLVPERVPTTLVITTSFPPDDSSVGYERGVGVSKAWDEATTQGAIETANYVIRRLDRFSRSKPADTNRNAKVEAFCIQFMETAFRRPLSEEQKKLFITSQFKGVKQIDDAVKRVVLLTLKSPRFLYLGLDQSKPDDYLVAERLSFALWDSLPDQELRKVAAAKGLRSREKVSQQARRMLADPRAKSKMRYFLHQWVQMNHVEDLSKDSKLYPGFTPEIIGDLRTSLDLFLNNTVWSEKSSYKELLLADYLFVNERLAKFYGIETNVSGFVRADIDPKPRSGIVTHPYLLAAFSYAKSTSPIHRGVFLTRNVVGRALKPPPTAVAFNDAEFSPDLTMREKVVQLTKPETCQTCHSVINPLGFSLEQYDAVGRFRTEENEKPIDPTSDYTTDDGQTIRFRGARDLAEYAVRSEHAQNAFIEQLFHQIVKQPVMAYGPNVMTQLRNSFVASDFNLQKLLVDIASVSALHGMDQSKGALRKI